MEELFSTVYQAIAAQILCASLMTAVLLGFYHQYRRPFLRYWVLCWGATLVALLALPLKLPPLPTADQAWQAGWILARVSRRLNIAAGYVSVAWLLFGNHGMATGRPVPPRMARLVPLAIVAGALLGFFSGRNVLFGLHVPQVLSMAAYFYGAWAVLRPGDPAKRGHGSRLMGAGLLVSGLQDAALSRGAGFFGSGVLGALTHAGVIDLTLLMILGLAMVVWLLEGERTQVIALSQAHSEAERDRAADRERSERVRECVREIAIASSSTSRLADLFREVHRIVARVLPAPNLYVALREPAGDRVTFPYFADEREPPPAPRRGGRGLTEHVLRTGEPLLATPEVVETLRAAGEIDPVGAPCLGWLGVPLRVHRGVIGMLAVQTYSETVRYGVEERDLLGLVSAQVAQAVERVRAEEARAEQARLMTEIVSGAAQGIAALDRDLAIRLWNPFLERLTGRPGAEVIGQGIASVLPGIGGSPGDPVLERARGGEALSREWRSSLPGEPWLAMTCGPLRDAGGGVTGVVALIRDVSERKAAESERARLLLAVRTAAEEWRETFDTVDVLVVLLDADGRVTRLNRAAAASIGRPAGSCLGLSLPDLGNAEPWATANTLLDRLHERGIAVAGAARDAESGLTWSLSITRFAAAESGVERTVLVARDITPIVRLEESLRRKEHLSAMGSLVAGVAHEVRNPLFGISSTVDAFATRFGDEAAFEPYFSTLRSQVGRLGLLMGDLLDYGRPLEPDLAPAAIADVLGEAVGACAFLAHEHQVEVTHLSMSELPPVVMDRKRLVQVFQNAIQNAIQHSPRGGRVTVETDVVGQPAGGWVRVAIRDTGAGFDPADLPRLFEPFFTRRRGGTGLGLSIVERIVSEHGGHVVARNHPTGGAELVVRLPVSGRPADTG